MSAMIQDYGSDTVSMVFHSISPRVECEDFSAWRTLVQQLREYSFFDRRGIEFFVEARIRPLAALLFSTGRRRVPAIILSAL